MANSYNDPRAQYLQDHAAYVKRLQDQQAAAQATPQRPSVMQRFQNMIGYTPEQFDQTAQTSADQQPAPGLTPYAMQQFATATPPQAQPSGGPDYGALTRDPGAHADALAGSKEFADVPTAAPAPDAAPQQMPGSLKDWGWWDQLTAGFSDDKYKQAKDAQANDRKNASTANQMAAPAQAAGNQDSPFFLTNNGDDAMPDAMPAAGEDTPVQQAPNVDPQAQAVADIQRQKAMIDAIYPQRQTDDGPQRKADADADKESQRTAALAQLAFFSGITQGAGGQWEGVGKGLAAAGQTYSAGFDRYQKALQGRAARSKADSDENYKDQVGRSDAAVKLYQNDQSLAEKRNTTTRQAIKDRQSEIDKYFTTRIGLLKGNEYNPTDQGAVDKEMKNWRLSRDRGEIVTNNDVSDQ